MKLSRCLAVGFVIGSLTCGTVRADKETEELKQRIEQLEVRLNLAKETAELMEKENELLRKENALLKGENEEAENEADDQFGVGMVWKGEAKQAKKNADTAHWAISVSERDGKKFKGVVAAVGPDGNKFEFPVAGTAPASGNGLVVIESPVIGRAQMFLRGRINNGEIALAFSGVTRLGKKIFGSATLRPK
ncbi:MAG: hypothetical protein WD065_22240 [Planctomycetaceae bacterium]